MTELHIALIREIGGKQMVAHMELDYEKLEECQPSEQARVFLAAYQKAKRALDETAVDKACDKITNLIPFSKNGKKDIHIDD